MSMPCPNHVHITAPCHVYRCCSPSFLRPPFCCSWGACTRSRASCTSTAAPRGCKRTCGSTRSRGWRGCWPPLWTYSSSRPGLPTSRTPIARGWWSSCDRTTRARGGAPSSLTSVQAHTRAHTHTRTHAHAQFEMPPINKTADLATHVDYLKTLLVVQLFCLGNINHVIICHDVLCIHFVGWRTR